MKKITHLLLTPVALFCSASAFAGGIIGTVTTQVWGGPLEMRWDAEKQVVKMNCPGAIVMECYKTTPAIPGLMLLPLPEGEVLAHTLDGKTPEVDKDGRQIGEVAIEMIED